MRAIARAALGLAGLLAGAEAANAIDIRVGSDSSCNFHSITDALDSLASGDHGYHILLKGETFSDTIVVNGKTFTLDGGYANCTDSSRAGATTISANHTGDSVIEISGHSDVVLSNLSITNGSISSSNGAGGGINFDGYGTVALQEVNVHDNYAGYGGGINVSASGGTALLYLNAGTIVTRNTAQYSGGGIRMHGDSILYAMEDRTLIYQNTAIGMDGMLPRDGYGGGVEVVAPARAYIGSPGYGSQGVISANRATYGGGISLTGAGGLSDIPIVELFTTDASRPVRIQGNTATTSGGGIQLEPNFGLTTGSDPRLCAIDFRIDGNAAPDGSAIYDDTESFASDDLGGFVRLNRDFDVCNQVDPRISFGAVPCASGVLCNSIDNNSALDTDLHLTDGATIRVRHSNYGTQGVGLFKADRVTIRANVGGATLRFAQNRGYTATLTNCLIVGNVSSAELLRTDDDSVLSMTGCTIAGNTIGAANVLSMSDDVSISQTLIWQPGKATLAHIGGSGPVAASDIIASEVASLAGANNRTRLITDPRFMDAAHGDFHLQASSPAVDATFNTASGSDLDGNPRGKDLPVVPNFYAVAAGGGDVGAYELQSLGNLVLNPGFDTDLRLWTEVVPGTNQWRPADPIFTSATTRIAIHPSADGSHAGLTQCVRVPGPAVYELTGKGSGFNFGITNATRIHWRYLAGTDDTCAAPPDAEGDVYFPLAADGLPRPSLAPVFINVSASRWGRNSAIQLTTFVDTSHAGPSFDTVGVFDDISITAATDEIFRDGFE